MEAEWLGIRILSRLPGGSSMASEGSGGSPIRFLLPKSTDPEALASNEVELTFGIDASSLFLTKSLTDDTFSRLWCHMHGDTT